MRNILERENEILKVLCLQASRYNFTNICSTTLLMPRVKLLRIIDILNIRQL